MERLNRFYLALSRISQLMVRVRDAPTLFTEICRVCVDTGHAQMACLYLREGHVAVRVAVAGPAEEFLADVPQPLDLSDPRVSGSYTAATLNDGLPRACQDYPNDPRNVHWRALALRHGIHAMAWLPIQRGGRVIGVLMLSASETGFFTEPLMQLLGEMVAGISFALDHIDREAALTAALRQAEEGFERFSHLFHSAPLAAAIISLTDRRVIDVNAACCRQYDVTREALIGHTFHSQGAGPEAPDLANFYAEIRRHGRVGNLLINARSRGGTRPRPELLNAERIDYRGESCHLVMSLDLSSLSEAKRARSALAEAQAASQAKTEFLSRMSHELRTPLHAMLGFAQLLQADEAAPLTPQQQTQARLIADAGWHLLALINDVLDVSRIEGGHLRVDLRPVALTPLLDEALHMCAPLAGPLAVCVAADYRAQPAHWVRADPIRLRQVLINLLSNAFKYNRPAGTVRVATRLLPGQSGQSGEAGEQVQIEVSDTGLGMTREQLAGLYQPFNRLGRERGGVEGAGIGLALTRQLVQLMHGQLTLDSEAGAGTRVGVQLPACEAESPALAAADTPAAEALQHDEAPRGVVLYIEDHPVNRQLVEQMLARWPQVQLVLAENGATGLALARSLQPDLVLLDMHLPDMDGIALLRQLQQGDATRTLTVVALSASAMPDDVAAVRAAGAADYWTKPLDLQRFTRDVRQRLRAHALVAGPAAG